MRNIQRRLTSLTQHRPLKPRLLLLLLLSMLLTAIGCAPKSEAPAANETIDKTVFAFIPTRTAYLPPQGTMPDEDARKIENALRLTYSPVECTGKNARLDMNLIMGASHANVDYVRRNGRSVVIIQGGVSGTTMSDCHVVGSYVAGAETFMRVFARPAQTDEEFAFQQALYLSIRSPWRLHAGALSDAFNTFMAEQLGLVPSEDRTWASLNVIQLDRLFNPCSTDTVPGGRDKNVNFQCIHQSSYANTVAFAPNRDKMLSFIAAAEKGYLAKLGQLNPSDGPEVEGMTAALSAIGSPYDIKVSSNAAAPSQAAPSAAPVEPNATGTAYPLSVGVPVSGLRKTFGARVMDRPDDVASMSNPRIVNTPPQSIAESAARTMGTDAGNGWRKVGDAYVALVNNGYVTSQPVAGANGTVYRTRSWQIINQHYWSPDLGRTTWEFDSKNSRFLRTAFTGNAFDTNQGAVPTSTTSGSVTTKDIPLTASKLPVGWKVVGPNELEDPSGQFWVWNKALGAFVKLPPSTAPPSSTSSGGSGTISVGSGSGSGGSSGGSGSGSSGSGSSGSGTSGSGTSGSGTSGSGTSGSGTSGSGTTPGGTTPGSTTPGSTTPGSTTPGSTTPSNTASVDANAASFAQAQGLPGNAEATSQWINTPGNQLTNQQVEDIGAGLGYGSPPNSANADPYTMGTTAADGTISGQNICGDMAYNTQGGFNQLGVNSGQVGVQWPNPNYDPNAAAGTPESEDTEGHAVNYVQTGTDADGNATYVLYDPQSGVTSDQFTGNAAGGPPSGDALAGAVTSLGNNIQNASPDPQNPNYEGTGPTWTLSTDQNGNQEVLAPGETFPREDGTPQDGQNSPVRQDANDGDGGGSNFVPSQSAGQSEADKTTDTTTTAPPADEGTGTGTQPSDGNQSPNAQANGNPSSNDGNGNDGNNASNPGSSDNSAPSDDGSDDSTASNPAPADPPADDGSSFPGGDTSGNGVGSGDDSSSGGGGDDSSGGGGGDDGDDSYGLHLKSGGTSGRGQHVQVAHY